MVFTLDILLRFNTAYEPARKKHEGQLVTNRWRIAGHYLSTSFLLDFLSIVPAYLEVGQSVGLLHLMMLQTCDHVTRHFKVGLLHCAVIAH